MSAWPLCPFHLAPLGPGLSGQQVRPLGRGLHCPSWRQRRGGVRGGCPVPSAPGHPPCAPGPGTRRVDLSHRPQGVAGASGLPGLASWPRGSPHLPGRPVRWPRGGLAGLSLCCSHFTEVTLPVIQWHLLGPCGGSGSEETGPCRGSSGAGGERQQASDRPLCGVGRGRSGPAPWGGEAAGAAKRVPGQWACQAAGTETAKVGAGVGRVSWHGGAWSARTPGSVPGAWPSAAESTGL